MQTPKYSQHYLQFKKMMGEILPTDPTIDYPNLLHASIQIFNAV